MVPILLAFSALILFSAVTPVMMLRNEGSSLKGFLSLRKDSSIIISFKSLSILAGVASLCWSLVLYDTDENFCMVLLISRQEGRDISQTRRWASDMPFPLVNPSVVFTDFIRICSIARSREIPDQNLFFVEPHGILVESGCILLDVVPGALSYPEDTNTLILYTNCDHSLPNRVACYARLADVVSNCPFFLLFGTFLRYPSCPYTGTTTLNSGKSAVNSLELTICHRNSELLVMFVHQ